jgi:hypothetical protein
VSAVSAFDNWIKACNARIAHMRRTLRES